MDRKWCAGILQAMVVALALAAVFQELEKPDEAREWHGKIAGFIPYDFRVPTIERFLRYSALAGQSISIVCWKMWGSLDKMSPRRASSCQPNLSKRC